MNDKKVENEINKAKKAISNIDSNISFEKKRITKCIDLGEVFSSINRKMTSCNENLNSCITSEEVTNMIENNTYDNSKNYRSMMSIIDESLTTTKKNINKLSEDREQLQKKLNDLYDKKQSKEK